MTTYNIKQAKKAVHPLKRAVMLQHWTCFKGMSQCEIMGGLYNPKSDDKTTVYNALAWYALEEVANVVYNMGCDDE